MAGGASLNLRLNLPLNLPLALPQGFSLQGDLLGPSAQRLFDRLWRDTPWRQDDILLFGRRIRQPRLVYWCADPGVSYRYSGLRLHATPWHPAVDELRESLNRELGCAFNSVLLNAYRDGEDSMGWHADNEPELGPHPLIASYSLGATRRFRLRPAVGGASIGFDLEHDCLLVMQGRSQLDWRHAVPKTRRPVGLRINLTFRTILQLPA